MNEFDVMFLAAKLITFDAALMFHEVVVVRLCLYTCTTIISWLEHEIFWVLPQTKLPLSVCAALPDEGIGESG